MASHNAQSIYCTNGQGIDRHLMGLRVMLAKFPPPATHQFGTLPPAMMKRPCFGESATFKLSTSNVSPAILQKGGFGPVHEGFSFFL